MPSKKTIAIIVSSVTAAFLVIIIVTLSVVLTLDNGEDAHPSSSYSTSSSLYHSSSSLYSTSSQSSSSFSSSSSEEEEDIPGVIKNNPYMTNEMDSFEILSSTPFSGVKPAEWEMKYDKYPYWQCGLTFTDEEKESIIAENQEYMNNLLMHAKNGTLKRMPTSLGGEQQFEAESVNWEADRLKVRYGLFGQVLGQRAVAWAFPGEIVTVEFPEGMNYNGLMLSIGKCNRNPSSQWLNVNKWSDNRMPIDSIGFTLSDEANQEYVINNTVKIGSPFGGMVYLSVDSTFANAAYINFTNVGRAPIIIYNRTTNEEWNNELKNAPGNVAEIRTPGNRFVFTARYIRELEDAQFIADYWLKAIAVSNNAVGLERMPITMNYDERVDAGAAVSFVGAWYTQHPSNWAEGCVDKSGLINSGNWGSLHEMNHQMQGTYKTGGAWGMGDPTEETNNVMNTINYILYSNIAGHRHSGLVNWEYVSDGYSTLKSVYAKNFDQPHLRSYISIAHGLGPDALMDVIHAYYGAWYDNNYGGVYGIERNTESAFCLLAAGAIKRDTRYFCKLFNYSIQANVSEAIKNMGYPSYYPFFNLYAKSYNGYVYGRTYTLPVVITSRLNFTATTAIDPEATEVAYTIKSGLTKGKLVKVADGVYDYTPGFEVNDSDSFVLSIDCKVNGEKVHIEQEGTFLLDPHIITYDAYINVTVSDLDAAIELTETAALTPNASDVTSTIMGIAAYNYGAIESMFVERGKLVVPATGYYTLFMRVDDKGKLLVDLDGSGDYVQLLRIDTYTGSYSRTKEGGFHTLVLEEGKEYPFVLHNLNIGGQGLIQIGYCYHGASEADVNVSTCAISNVGSSMLLHKNATGALSAPEFVVPGIYYTRPTRFLTNSYRVIPKCAADDEEGCAVECLEIPPVDSSEPGGRCVDMFDDNTGTFHHTPWRTSTSYPVNYSFAFPENVTFNYVYAHHRKSIDSWGYVEVYVRSPETGEMVLLTDTLNTGSLTTEIDLPELVRTDRVDFKVYNNSGGRNYVVVTEVSLGVKAADFTRFTNAHDADVKVDGFAEVVAPGAAGGYVLTNEREGEGSVCFSIKANRFGLYGIRETTSGRFRITVDGVEVDVGSQTYYSRAERTLFYTRVFDEEEAKVVHDVCLEVVEGTISLDVIGWDR